MSKKELHDVGIVTMNTTFDNPVPVYDMDRTICDLIRNLSKDIFYDLHISSQLHGQSIVPADLRAALIATAKKRGTEKHLADTPEAFDEVEADPHMEKLWRAYQKKFSYAADLSWHTVMESIRSLYELAQR